MPRALPALALALACAALVACVPAAEIDPTTRLDVDPYSFRQYETPPTHLEMGWRHLTEARYGSALQIFQRGRAVDPDAIEPLYGLALAYDGLGRSSLSDGYFALAERQETRRARLLTNLAYRARRQGHDDRALAYAVEALSLEPANPVLQQNVELARTQATWPND